jgi:hypothetical protein
MKNNNKSKEFGRDNGITPSAGQRLEPTSELASASTLSESNLSAKTGGSAASLNGVRTDSAGQVLTTNQGVPSLNSLKAGLESARGHAQGVGEIHAPRCGQIAGTVPNGAARRWWDPHPQGGDPGRRWRVQRSLRRGRSGCTHRCRRLRVHCRAPPWSG